MRRVSTVLVLAALATATVSATAASPARGQGSEELVVAASASASALRITVGDEPLTVGRVEAALDTGWTDLADPPVAAPDSAACPDGAIACATGAALAPPRGEAVTASAPGSPGPVETAPANLPATLDGLLTLSGEPATAVARDGTAAGAEATSGTTTLDLTPVRAVTGDLPGLRALLRGLGDLDRDGPAGRAAERLDRLAEGTTGIAALRAQVLGSSASTSAAPPSATARGGSTRLVVAPLPGDEVDDGLVVIDVSAAEVAAGGDGSEPSARATPAQVEVRVLNPVRGAYDEHHLTPGPATTCAGPDPVQVCVTGGRPRTVERGPSASAEVTELTVTVFDDPLPKVRFEVAGVEAHVAAVRPPARVPTETALAALLALVAATAIVVGVIAARRRVAGPRADPQAPPGSG